MARFNCFSILIGRKKKIKENAETAEMVRHKGMNSAYLNARSNVKVVSHESPVGYEAAEVAYEGEDEHEESSIIKRDISDFNLQAKDGHSGEEMHSRNEIREFSFSFDTETNTHSESKIEKDTEKGFDIQSGHVSDPGFAKAEFWASPRLKRTCSNLETSEVLKNVVNQLSHSKCQSFEDLQKLAEGIDANSGSPGSVMTHHSADKVMLKKHSSSQVLPSRSRRLWWKLLLWSHRNMHEPSTVRPRPQAISHVLNQHGGYSSDTLEPNRVTELRNMHSPRSFNGGSINKGTKDKKIYKRWDGLHGGDSGLWLQNQWVAVPTESSSFARVNEWVKDLDVQPPIAVNENVDTDEDILFPPSPENDRSPSTNHLTRRPDINLSEEIVHANSLIQTLNSSSAVAHISGVGLKVIPTIAHFSSLRSVNLSSNFIVHIAPGVLPKGLHTLNLSKNKISTIEGLRELTRLRVLDLSYNRISKIGHGLSNCTLIKELYLAGNKISDIEGLHRLLKLTVLDLSFNKITTTKALGQLVANYNSLLALNLLGNPIQSNISDDQLRKAVCGLIPKLVYLNKQPIKPQRAREVLGDSVAKAALGNSSWGSRKKAVKRVSQGGSATTSGHRSTASVGQKSRSRSKSRTRRATPSALASTSR